ncbi:MAG TPA: YbhN family protein [Acidimicrobiales bacterium]|nr:YbhN family protein [Acidimicrobiales bacterium]
MRWTVTAVVVLLVVEFLVLPRLGGFRHSLHRVSDINVVWVLAALVLEAAALGAYAQLTYTLLSPGAPSRWRLLRIDLSGLALSHVVPGGTAPGLGLSYRLLSQSGVSTADAGFGLAMQGVGSAVVLNVIFWLALVVSLFTNGYHALYTWAAAAGTILMAAFAAVVVALTKGRRRTIETVRQWSQRVPFLDADRLAEGVQRIADRLKDLAGQRERLSQAVVWAAANWLFDAACLWLFIIALHGYISPINLMVAYGLANILAAIPITPGGLGVVETVLVTTLAGFHVPWSVAGPAVLGYRLVNFWIPIPVGGLSYLSLRFESVGWRQRLSQAREEIVENHPSAASTNGARRSPSADDRRADDTGTGPGAPPAPQPGASRPPEPEAPGPPEPGASQPQELQGRGRSVG